MDSVKYVHTHNFKKKRGHKFEKEWEAWEQLEVEIM